MSTKTCDDCGKDLGKRYKALDGRFLCSACRGFRAEALDSILFELTRRTRQERLKDVRRKWKSKSF